ncbi:hypothetical protein N836_11620 [Leptolyngbya sp. Heron Island J]|uniref:hypothetical protein n=1 Tax=Leptolyngbya sp. Heron Island J TaxID=1385935 RepID=UPI0003B93FFB|nr:hypothetical protein [Leptolyngbya sp. Heron Island J]ESA35348.1 hypothetical protein N836_11620 [Leptolyngbya sp. Heron Island J]
MQVLAVIQRHIRQQYMQTQVSDLLHMGALAMGAATLLVTHTAQARMAISSSAENNAVVIHPLLAQTAPVVSDHLSNGIYLFGEKPLPDQLQTAYMIFEAQAGQVVGAFYSPHSSFDCFRGSVENTQLSLAITETYSQEEYAYALDLEDTPVAGPGSRQFAIEGFHQIEAVSENDLRMLSTCQAHYSQTI